MHMKYRVRVTKRIRAAVRKLPRDERRHVKSLLLSLSAPPPSAGSFRPLPTTQDLNVWTIGRYLFVCELDHEKSAVNVLVFAHHEVV